MNETPILEVAELVKDFGSLRAVDGISFMALSGEIIGLLGPNGAGKTTTINMILGILKSTSGSITVSGVQSGHVVSNIKSMINFAAVYAHMPANLTVRQNLYVFGLLYGVKKINKRIDQLMAEFDLEDYSHTRAGLLSSGELSRLNLAKAVINEPKLLLLDEPTASLDPSISQIIRERIRGYVTKTGAAVLWTSHNMNEIETVCDRVFFLSHGKILLSGDPKMLPSIHGKPNLEELFIAVAREPLQLKE
jgi:ABC-2 type transport system ATP-binding protein